jgi:hypothetical protein
MTSSLKTKTALALAASVSLAAAFAAPTIAQAQPYDSRYAYDDCRQHQQGSTVGGALLGGLAGAAIGGAIGHGTGAAVGAVAGGATGAAIGHSTHDCDAYGQGYYDRGPPAAYDHEYYDGRYYYSQPQYRDDNGGYYDYDNDDP